MDELKIKSVVREAYTGIVTNKSSCCSGPDPREHAKCCGYSDEELAIIPREAADERDAHPLQGSV